MFEYIDSKEQLHQFVEKISETSWIAIDTEFIREKHYFSELCLIQVATDDQLACIDPLAIDDLSALREVLLNKDITKILHAAYQDLEIFYQLFGEVPAPVFDTQMAAAVLGAGDQIGYSRLIQEYLSVQLEKSQSRTNWAKRPLSDKQLDYAIDDVRYLREVYPLLLKKLEQLGRESWLEKDFAWLTAAETYEPDVHNIWKKVKGMQRLKPAQLAILRELADWRETQAIKKNLPRRWMASDDVLLEIAVQQPQSAEEFTEFRGIKPNNPYIRDWMECIKTAKALPREEWPSLPSFRKPTAQQATLIELLMLVVHYQAKQHGISASLIAGRKKIEKMVLAGENQLADDWRGQLVNQQFLDLLSGRGCIRVDNGARVVIESG